MRLLVLSRQVPHADVDIAQTESVRDSWAGIEDEATKVQRGVRQVPSTFLMFGTLPEIGILPAKGMKLLTSPAAAVRVDW